MTALHHLNSSSFLNKCIMLLTPFPKLHLKLKPERTCWAELDRPRAPLLLLQCQWNTSHSRRTWHKNQPNFLPTVANAGHPLLHWVLQQLQLQKYNISHLAVHKKFHAPLQCNKHQINTSLSSNSSLFFNCRWTQIIITNDVYSQLTVQSQECIEAQVINFCFKSLETVLKHTLEKLACSGNCSNWLQLELYTWAFHSSKELEDKRHTFYHSRIQATSSLDQFPLQMSPTTTYNTRSTTEVYC